MKVNWLSSRLSPTKHKSKAGVFLQSPEHGVLRYFGRQRLLGIVIAALRRRAVRAGGGVEGGEERGREESEGGEREESMQQGWGRSSGGAGTPGLRR